MGVKVSGKLGGKLGDALGDEVGGLVTGELGKKIVAVAVGDDDGIGVGNGKVGKKIVDGAVGATVGATGGNGIIGMNGAAETGTGSTIGGADGTSVPRVTKGVEAVGVTKLNGCGVGTGNPVICSVVVGFCVAVICGVTVGLDVGRWVQGASVGWK